ncbi:MAG: VWA domain-containing protein [Planctomycetes bacterium]|nr:VWA domain-containing protein [Planctomycetota bacterium]
MHVHSATLLAYACLATLPAAEAPAAATDPTQPRIQLAILLDTSSSMSGLIDQARARIWSIVNDLTSASHGGRAPRLEVALYEYGKSSLPQEEHWLRQILPMGNDLDRLSEHLFTLTTNGGEEYCGAVIDQAVRNLSWSQGPNDLREILIAGNEPFTQGPVDALAACRSAIAKGIIVNTIHCGTDSAGRAGGWPEGARAAEGAYLVIDHNAVAAPPTAPQDDELAKLNLDINKTYLPYGAGGIAGAQRQEAQDGNASSIGSSVLANRAASKASGYYTNGSWDLVDAVKEAKVKLEELPADQLPESLRALAPQARAVKVAEFAAERARLQKRMGELAVAREAWLAEQRRAAIGPATLDDAITTALRAQAKAKGYVYAR